MSRFPEASVEHDVCNVIPDYQKEVEQLEASLAHNTARQKAYRTRIINQQDLLIAKLEEDQCNHVKEKQAWAHREAALLEQIELCQCVAHAKQTTELLMTFMDELRAVKRTRNA